MKKLSLSILVLMIISVLAACAHSEAPVQEAMEETDIVGDSLVLVRAEDVLTAPYINWIWAESYYGEGWLCADGISIYYKFGDVLEEIPRITYSDNFEILYASGVSPSRISIYDDSFAELTFNADEDDLRRLEEGVYYLVIYVSAQGRYIKAENKYEHSGYECVYKLEVKTLD